MYRKTKYIREIENDDLIYDTARKPIVPEMRVLMTVPYS